MNIMQKRYNKIYLNAEFALIFFLYTVYFGVLTSHKILFSRISLSSLPCAKDSFLK